MVLVMKTPYFLFLKNENYLLEQELEFLLLRIMFLLIHMFQRPVNDDLGQLRGTGTFFCSCSLLLEFALMMQLLSESVLSGWGFL